MEWKPPNKLKKAAQSVTRKFSDARAAARLFGGVLQKFDRGFDELALETGKSKFRLKMAYWTQTVPDLCRDAWGELISARVPAVQSQKTVIVFPGYMAKATQMPKLLNALAECGYEVRQVKGWLFFSTVRRILAGGVTHIRQAKEKNQQIVLLGNSFGGAFAHQLGRKHDLPSISMSTPLDAKSGVFGVAVRLFGMKGFQDVEIPPKGISLVEQHSETIPFSKNDPPQIRRIEGVYSHLAINNPKVVQTIVKATKSAFQIHYEMTPAVRPVGEPERKTETAA
ncbi:Uncharacterised protein [uncultured archaeon]|nr:Uncharacterised protein [uncultured archaeon]